MSAVRAVNYLLSNNAGLIAVVPAARILTGLLPIETVLPAVSLRQVSGSERLDVEMAAADKKLRIDRVQVTVHSKSYAEAKALLELVRSALQTQHGTVDTVLVDSLLPAGIGPDLQDPTSGFYQQSTDFLVSWHAA